jgi:hypothetical protein
VKKTREALDEMKIKRAEVYHHKDIPCCTERVHSDYGVKLGAR